MLIGILGQSSWCGPVQANSSSISLESFRPKHAAHPLGLGAGRKLGLFELVIDPEFLPFKAAHLMKGQHLDALDITQVGKELRDVGEASTVIGQARHKDEADPNGSLACGQTPRKSERWLNVLSRQVAVLFRTPC